MGVLSRSATFRGPACHSTFRARRHTPLYRLKTPSQQVAVVRISHWPKGWILPKPHGSQGFRQATITSLSHSCRRACRHLEIRTLKGLLNSKRVPRPHWTGPKSSVRDCFTVGFTKWSPYLQMSGEHAQTLHECSFRHLRLPHLQLDERRTRLRNQTQVRLSVAGHRPALENPSCSPCGSPHAPVGADGHSLLAADPGSLSASPFSPAMA
jgi:hypothetical protein